MHFPWDQIVSGFIVFSVFVTCDETKGNVDFANESSLSCEMLKNKKPRNIRVKEDRWLSLSAWKHSFVRREPEK